MNFEFNPVKNRNFVDHKLVTADEKRGKRNT